MTAEKLRSIMARVWFGLSLVTFLTTGMRATAARAQSCDDFDECTVQDACQADGSCKGTPKENGTACDDGNGCTSNDHCQAGRCVGGVVAQDGTPCTSLLGLCDPNPTCQFGFCFGNPIDCSQGGDKCSFCNPQTGQCQSSASICNDACSTGQCDPATGDCINVQPKNEGQSCDDFNACTGNDHCQAGTCMGTAGTVATPTHTPIGVASATQTAAPTATATPTFTNLPVPTQTPTATVQTTPSGGACPGDCGGDGEVTVNELIKGVNIALGNATVDTCPAFDLDGSGDVTIDEIIKGVNAALNGCPAVPTATATLIPSDTPVPTPTTVQGTATPTLAPPTATGTPVPATNTPTGSATVAASATPTLSAIPTATPTLTPVASATGTHVPTSTTTATVTGTPTPAETEVTGASPTPTPTEATGDTPTPTKTPGGPSIANRASAAIQSTTSGFLVIPNLLSAVLGHGLASSASSAAISIGPLPFTCPGGGGGSVTCSQDLIPPFSLGPPTYTVTINNCAVDEGNGKTATFNGTVTAIGQQGDFCGTIPTSATVAAPNLTVTTTSSAGSTTATFTNVAAAVDLSCSSGDCQCTYDTVALHVTGGINVVSKDPLDVTRSTTQAIFNGTDIAITVQQYASQCVPVIYSMQVDGNVSLTTDGHAFAATFANYMLADDATSGTDMVTITGGVSSDCLGAPINVTTVTSLAITNGKPCPVAGALQVAADVHTDLVSYSAGGVQIDLGNDGSVDETFDTCLDPRLAVCPAG